MLEITRWCAALRPTIEHRIDTPSGATSRPCSTSSARRSCPARRLMPAWPGRERGRSGVSQLLLEVARAVEDRAPRPCRARCRSRTCWRSRSRASAAMMSFSSPVVLRLAATATWASFAEAVRLGLGALSAPRSAGAAAAWSPPARPPAGSGRCRARARAPRAGSAAGAPRCPCPEDRLRAGRARRSRRHHAGRVDEVGDARRRRAATTRSPSGLGRDRHELLAVRVAVLARDLARRSRPRRPHGRVRRLPLRPVRRQALLDASGLSRRC